MTPNFHAQVVAVLWESKGGIQNACTFLLPKEETGHHFVMMLREMYMRRGFKSAIRIKWLGRMLFMQRVTLGIATFWPVWCFEPLSYIWMC
jgi:hypothetical protein